MSRTIKHWQEEIHQLAKDKGWYDTDRGIPEMLCLMHSEISEALEEYRQGQMEVAEHYLPNDGGNPNKPIGFPIEIADLVIRALDLCEFLGIDLEQMIEIKHAYNRERKYRHGNRAC